MPWAGANLTRTFRQTALDGYIVYRNTERIHGTTLRRDADGNPLYGDTVHIPVPTPLPPERISAVRNALAPRSFTKVGDKGYVLSGRMFSPCGYRYTGNYRSSRDRTTYRCMGRKSTPPCECKEILAEPMEAAVWSEIVKVIGNGENLACLAAEWLGGIPERAASYRERIAELDAQIELSRTTRKRKLLGLAAAFTSDADNDGGDLAEDIQNTIKKMKTELAERENRLVATREETVEWLEDAEEQTARAREVIDLIAATRPELGTLTYEQKSDLLQLLDVRIEVTSGHTGQLRPAGCPFEEWFTSRGQLVPPPLSDEQWARMEHLFPELRKDPRNIPPRRAVEGALTKVRNGIQWKELPSSFGKYLGIYQKALSYMNDGRWEGVMKTLGDYDGTPVPPRYVMPDFKITGSFDTRLSGDGCNAGEGIGDQIPNCSLPTPASSSVTTARSCGRCRRPPPTAG